MDDQAGQRWFTRRDDRFVAVFARPLEHRAAFQSLTGELVDLRLAHYTHSPLSSPKAPHRSEGTPLSSAFPAKGSHSGGKPLLFLPARRIRRVPLHGPRARPPPPRPGVGLPVRDGGVPRHPSGRRRERPWQQRSPPAAPRLVRPRRGSPWHELRSRVHIYRWSVIDGAWVASPRPSLL